MIEHAETRASNHDSLTDRQRDVVVTIAGYQDALGEPPSVRGIARRLNVHHSTIQQHLYALRRKGWIRHSGGAPFLLRRPSF